MGGITDKINEWTHKPASTMTFNGAGGKPTTALVTPAAAPDFTDKLIQEAARSEEDWQKTKRGRRSTFLTGESVSGAAPAGRKSLLGG